jgi:uncharacterized protein
MKGSVMKNEPTLSLEGILDEPQPFDFDLSFPLNQIDREPLLQLSPVRFEGEVARIEGGYSLDGRLAYSGHLECSRCLASYPFEEDQEFSLVLYKRRPALSSDEVALTDEDLDVWFYEDPEVPVAPIVEERIQIAVPMKPLCREDCRGLCARCGQDLNQGACGCNVEPIDPRWEALKTLKKA